MSGTVSNRVRLCRVNDIPTNYRYSRPTGLVPGKVWCLFREKERSDLETRQLPDTDQFPATTNGMDRTQYRRSDILSSRRAFPNLVGQWLQSFYAYRASFPGCQ